MQNNQMNALQRVGSHCPRESRLVYKSVAALRWKVDASCHGSTWNLSFAPHRPTQMGLTKLADDQRTNRVCKGPFLILIDR